MRIKYIIFIFIVFGIVFLQEPLDSLKVKNNSKAPLLISTLPFLNNDPEVMFALSSLLLAIHSNSRDTLKNDYPNPNKALFLSSIPMLNLISDNEILYIPAFGQLYNKKPLKAFTMMAMKSYWLSEYHKSAKYDDIKDRNRSLWWLLILILYGMADAYVDAHLDQNINRINTGIINSNNGEIK